MKTRQIIVFLCSMFILVCAAQCVVSGGFYPADKNELSKAIDGYLKGYKLIRGEGDLISIVVPHAGYEYSGKIAAYAYKQLTNKSFDTVIVIGPSHYASFDGISVVPSGELSTPLGKVKIDKEFTSKLLSYDPKITYNSHAWEKEHSVEVQIPFLQKTLGNFQIVPVLVGYQSLENSYILANAILKASAGKKVLIVASTDLSHYASSEIGIAKDRIVIDAFSRGDVASLVEKLATGECEMCGAGAMITAMLVADNLGANSYEILKYGDTGDITGDKSSVVGYLSAAIYKRPVILDEIGKKSLLDVARKTLEGYCVNGYSPTVEVYQKNLQLRSGVFVTLNKDGKLRGCMGYIKPVKPLYLAVQEMTVAAATQDARFTPVTTEELPEINIEISVISNLRPITTSEVVVGRDGLMITRGEQVGVLLPQVAVENKWSREEFLENVCSKAQLDPYMLTDPDTRLFAFTADVFREE